jgi:integrase
MRSPYILYRRKTTKNKIMYYVRFYLGGGKYATAKSCGRLADELNINREQYPPSSKAGAKHIIGIWQACRGEAGEKQNPLLWEYCASFWDWENKSDYVRGKLERGQRIGKSHCSNSRYRILTYVKPRTEGLRVRDVTALDLDRLQLRLKHELEKLSAKSINSTMCAINTPLRELYRIGVIDRNPALNFRALPERPKQRGILSADEIKLLFSTPWEFQWHKLCAELGAFCGMRLGEILCLKAEDLDVDFQGLPVVRVHRSWNFIEGREKGTKTENCHITPLSATLRDGLLAREAENPHGNGLIFWSETPDKPLTERRAEHGFIKQLRKIGIGKEKREKRNIVFHSLRHTYNSRMRGKVPDDVLRAIIGHRNEKTTEHYTHLTDEKLQAAREAQNAAFSEV